MQINVYTPDVEESNTRQNGIKLFLAGSIDNGEARDWQQDIIRTLRNHESEHILDIYNPRRAMWNPDLEQNPLPGSIFNKQVNWELEHLEKADWILFHFEPDSKSPITLLELGLMLGSGKSMFIYCPKEYMRYGNVLITASKYCHKVYTDHDSLLFDLLTCF